MSETTNNERGARVLKTTEEGRGNKGAQSTEGVGARCLRLQRRGVGQGYSDYRVVEGQGGSD